MLSEGAVVAAALMDPRPLLSLLTCVTGLPQSLCRTWRCCLTGRVSRGWAESGGWLVLSTGSVLCRGCC